MLTEVASEWHSLGTFTLSFYVATGNLTKTETIPMQGRTISVDPNVIPLGSEVLIEGVIYIAEDTGHPKYITGNRIDMFLDSYDEAINRGFEDKEIFIRK